MTKSTKIILGAVIVVILTMGSIVTAAVYFITHWTERNIVTDIGEYESYFGAQGIHRTKNTDVWKKTGESYMVPSGIFPEELPETAKVEDFYYEYYNPWDPCYLSYLVYRCDEEDYEAEAGRLRKIPMPEQYLIYGATEFPYPLLAVDASDLGYLYAMGDEEQGRIIYVELTFYNDYTDIEYGNIIPKKYLPIGFDANRDNPTYLEHKAKIDNAGGEETIGCSAGNRSVSWN